MVSSRQALNCATFDGGEAALSVDADEEKESAEVRSDLLLFAVCNQEVDLSSARRINLVICKGARAIKQHARASENGFHWWLKKARLILVVVIK